MLLGKEVVYIAVLHVYYICIDFILNKNITRHIFCFDTEAEKYSHIKKKVGQRNLILKRFYLTCISRWKRMIVS